MIAHKPTEETRASVLSYAGVGVTQADIAEYLDIDAKTLRRHYRRELSRGKFEANALVFGRLFEECQKGNITALIFWCKCQGHWREVDRLEITGADGAAVELGRSDKRLEEALKGDPEARKALSDLYAKAFRVQE